MCRGWAALQPAPPAQPAEAWAEESADAFKAKVAYDKGAAAILLYTPPARLPAVAVEAALPRRCCGAAARRPERARGGRFPLHTPVCLRLEH